MMTDSQYIFIWWLLLCVIGAAGIPLSFVLFRKFADRGYGLSKILGILVISFLAFFFAILKLIPLSSFTLYGFLAIYAGVNLYLFKKNRQEIIKSVHKNLSFIIIEETLFAFGLILWAYVRAHQPDINGLEKFMDYGFVNANIQTKYLPAPDMWFSGHGINYYWFGHFVTAVLTRLSGIPSTITYNLMLATILGLSLSGTFSLVSTLITNFFKEGKGKRLAIVGGLISAVLLNFAGNFHTSYYIYKNGRDAYWYPDATRFIGYNPDIPDKTIHEFPIYSYVVADLHAHILNLPFVILFLSLLYNYLSSKEKGGLNSKSEARNHKQYQNSNDINPKHFGKLGFKLWNLFRISILEFRISKNNSLVLLGIVLGIMFMSNAWDFANYLLASGFVLLVYNLRKNGFNFESLYKTAFSLVIIIVFALLASLPFTLNFESIAQGVKLTHTKSPLWQLAILWGFPAVMTLIFLSRAAFSKVREDLFVIGLLITCWCLIALPEFIYVKDIYADTHYRANTMFKLTYQAFVMSYLASGYIAVRTIQSVKRTTFKIFFVLLFSFIFTSILRYGVIATKSYYADVKIYKGLDGETWLKEKTPDVYSAMIWLRQNNIGSQPVILEAPGDSYTEFNSISSYTGFPTVSGWFVHEWLWRGSPEFPQERVNDIMAIYTSQDGPASKKILDKYGVKYVIVGDQEREKYSNLDEQKFLSIGKLVFSSPTTKIYQVN